MPGQKSETANPNSGGRDAKRAELEETVRKLSKWPSSGGGRRTT